MLNFVVVSNKPLRFLSSDSSIKFVSTLDEIILKNVSADRTILISCISSEIIPEEKMRLFKESYNIHPGLPTHPGRDPHHWAHFQRVRSWGATLHVMQPAVDSGAILEVRSSSVDCLKCSPIDLLHLAEFQAVKLLEKFLNAGVSTKVENVSSLKWKEKKFRRSDLVNICNVTNCDDKLIERIIESFHVSGRQNIYIKLGEKKFYYG